jgi:hypothetical protein
VKSVYLNIFGWKFMKHFERGASYKNLGTSALGYIKSFVPERRVIRKELGTVVSN